MPKIYRSIKPNSHTQRFGENLYPGYVLMGLKGHPGDDWACPDGEKIYWDCDIKGKVIQNFVDAGTGALNGGKMMIVRTEDKDGIFYHRFCHLMSFVALPGQIVESGNLIAYADHTGTVTAPHLHRDMKPIYIDQYGQDKVIDPQNGYHGCVDIAPYFTNIFIKDLMANLQAQISVLTRIIEAIRELLKRKVA